MLPVQQKEFKDVPEPPKGVALVVLEQHDCPYLPGRTARYRAGMLRGDGLQMEGEGHGGGEEQGLYQRLMDANFRRSGQIVYQPVCVGCRACRQIRLEVGAFVESASQRRVRRKNAGVSVAYGTPTLTREKLELYLKYQYQRHGDIPKSHKEELADLYRFLYDSPIGTIEMEYRDEEGKLVAVGICDLSGSALSSVYVFYDPAESRRSLGVYTALVEIDTAGKLGMTHYYLGLHVEGCAKMAYKMQFRPSELLRMDGTWEKLG